MNSLTEKVEGRIALRTLTEKSLLGFGKYGELRVQEIIDFRGGVYLRWCYFNREEISFQEQILNKINITQKHYIKKPGTNKELGKKLGAKSEEKIELLSGKRRKY